MSTVKEKMAVVRASQRELQREYRSCPGYQEAQNAKKVEAYQAGVGNTVVLRDEQVDPIECPCCKQSVSVPTLEIVIDHYKVTPQEARILSAVWRGRGHPVVTERIFDSMYSDDPDGGPSPSSMYLAFKVSLCHLRARLKGSGISIETVGYRRGYRLVLGE